MAEYHIKQLIEVEVYYVVVADSDEEALELVEDGVIDALDCETIGEHMPYLDKIVED